MKLDEKELEKLAEKEFPEQNNPYFQCFRNGFNTGFRVCETYPLGKDLIRYISVYINDEYLENYLDDPDDLMVNLKDIITNAVEAYEGGAR